MSETHEGGCLCGAIRTRITGPIESVVHCHCRLCQRANGAAVVTWVTVPEKRFTLTKGTLARYPSSDHGERGFCGACGTQITFSTSRDPGSIDITLGSLDHPERHPADRHIWTESRLPWLHLDAHLPAWPKFTGSGSAPNLDQAEAP